MPTLSPSWRLMVLSGAGCKFSSTVCTVLSSFNQWTNSTACFNPPDVPPRVFCEQPKNALTLFASGVRVDHGGQRKNKKLGVAHSLLPLTRSDLEGCRPWGQFTR